MIPKDEASSKPPNTAALAGEGISKIHRNVHLETLRQFAQPKPFDALMTFGGRMKRF
jgi:hypothetical protein